MFSIGNLTLLTSELNSEIGNADLPIKMQALERGSAYFDAELERWKVSGVKTPSDSQISKRAVLLATEALQDVWGI